VFVSLCLVVAGTFTVNALGQLRLLKPLDAETQLSYALRLRVSDSGSPPLSIERSVAITVLPQNEAPVFELQGFAVNDDTVFYGLSKDTRLYTVRINDPDTAQRGTQTIVITGPGASLVVVKNGEILLAQDLTTDVASPIVFTVTVTDPDGAAVSERVELQLTRAPSGTGDGSVIGAPSSSSTNDDFTIYIVAGVLAALFLMACVWYYFYLRRRTSKAIIVRDQKRQQRATAAAQRKRSGSFNGFSTGFFHDVVPPEFDDVEDDEEFEMDNLGFDRATYLQELMGESRVPQSSVDFEAPRPSLSLDPALRTQSSNVGASVFDFAALQDTGTTSLFGADGLDYEEPAMGFTDMAASSTDMPDFGHVDDEETNASILAVARDRKQTMYRPNQRSSGVAPPATAGPSASFVSMMLTQGETADPDIEEEFFDLDDGSAL
jgi:hypothetical protein